MADNRTTVLLPDDSDKPASRPGTALRAAARRSRLTLLAIIVAIGILLVFIALRGGLSDGSPSSPLQGQAEPGPLSVVDGVPVGYARTRDGASAAAVHFELARSRPDYFTDSTVRRRVLTRMMAAAALEQQISQDDANTRPAMEVLGLIPGGLGPNGSRWMVHAAPLGVQVEAFTSQTATVNVWMSEVAGVIGDAKTPLPPTGSYTTYVVTLIWENNDWRIASLATKPGPVPASSGNQQASTLQDWERGGTFTAPIS